MGRKLNCEKARNFSTLRVLKRLGHFPKKESEKEAWFLSPFRSETQASLKVSKAQNRWYDHGAGIGGNVIDLVCLITKSTVKEALQFLREDGPSFSFHQQPFFSPNTEHQIQINKTKELSHVALVEYLQSRRIQLKTALRLCKEIHYSFKGKNYFAIGLKNDSGGWELRNKYYKNSSSPKDITHIKNENNRLSITEGMFDMLSLIEENIELERSCDLLILNSTAFIEKAKKICNEYDVVDLYLDNDVTGKRMTKILMEHSKKCIDNSNQYEGYKDVNEKKMVCTDLSV